MLFQLADRANPVGDVWSNFDVNSMRAREMATEWKFRPQAPALKVARQAYRGHFSGWRMQGLCP
jgi:hypothetical protein